jgi:hypothetical protein
MQPVTRCHRVDVFPDTLRQQYRTPTPPAVHAGRPNLRRRSTRSDWRGPELLHHVDNRQILPGSDSKRIEETQC